MNKNKILNITSLQSENENESFEDSILNVPLDRNYSSLERELKILIKVNDIEEFDILLINRLIYFNFINLPKY